LKVVKILRGGAECLRTLREGFERRSHVSLAKETGEPGSCGRNCVGNF
jgi:hypothetical protein